MFLSHRVQCIKCDIIIVRIQSVVSFVNVNILPVLGFFDSFNLKDHNQAVRGVAIK